MRHNPLREKLDKGIPTLGTHILSSWPTMVELVGHTRMFDYVEFVAEYAPYDLYALENLGRAVDLFDDMTAMMKIEQEPRSYLTVRAIGSGLQNVLFADIRSAEDARECVRAVRAEAPGREGRHGVGMRRDVGIVLESGSTEFVEALDRAVVVLMIEKESAVEDLEAILKVPGVDMVNFGPADYSMSVGLVGQRTHPRVIEAEQFVLETSRRLGIPFRAEINRVDDAKSYLDQGVEHFCLGTDAVVLFEWWAREGSKMLKSLGRTVPEEREFYGRAKNSRLSEDLENFETGLRASQSPEEA